MNFSIFQDAEQIASAKKDLEDNLNIDLDYTNHELDLRLIYDFCYKSARRYSASTCHNYFYLPSGFLLNPTNKDIEHDVFVHCLVSSLYTCLYLLLKSYSVCNSEIQKDIMEMGYFSLINMKILGVDYGIKRRKQSKNYYNESISASSRTSFYKSYKRLVSDNFYSRYFNEVQYKQIPHDSDMFPLFNSNFFYIMTKKYSSFKVTNLVNKILSASGIRHKNEYLRDFSLRFESFFKDILKYGFSGNNELDNLIFAYQAERTFSFNSISKIFESMYNAKYFCPDFYEIQAFIRLPNVFSRNNFKEYFYIWEKDHDHIDFINWLSTATFPIFEKTFFITLYQLIYKNNGEHKKTIHEMIEMLSRYLSDQNIISSMLYDIHGSDKRSYLVNYLKKENYELFEAVIKNIFLDLEPFNTDPKVMELDEILSTINFNSYRFNNTMESFDMIEPYKPLDPHEMLESMQKLTSNLANLPQYPMPVFPDIYLKKQP